MPTTTREVEDADVEVGGDEALPERQRHEGEREAGHDEVGGGAEQQRVRLGRDEVLLEEELHRVGHPLEEAAGAHPVVADAALHAGADAHLPPDRHAGDDGAEVDEHEAQQAHHHAVDQVGVGPGGRVVAQHGGHEPVHHEGLGDRREDQHRGEEDAGQAQADGQGEDDDGVRGELGELGSARHG
jgi:hypothetical protein